MPQNIVIKITNDTPHTRQGWFYKGNGSLLKTDGEPLMIPYHAQILPINAVPKAAIGIFSIAPATPTTTPATSSQVDKVRASAVEAGRNPDDIKVFMGLNVIVGATEALAWNKHAERERKDQHLARS